MNKIVTLSIKVALAVGVLVAVLTGCLMSGSDEGHGNEPCMCCGKKSCTCYCEKNCFGGKSHGVDASVSVRVGTGGIYAGAGGGVH